MEAGVWSVADAAAIGSSARWLRILVEIIDVPAAGAIAAATEVLRRLDELGVTVPRLLHGEDAAYWPLVARAGELGLPTRIGLEDATVGPDGASERQCGTDTGCPGNVDCGCTGMNSGPAGPRCLGVPRGCRAGPVTIAKDLRRRRRCTGVRSARAA